MPTELIWEGKYDENGRRRSLTPMDSAPIVFTEVYPDSREAKFLGDEQRESDWQNQLLYGENRQTLAQLQHRYHETIDLIYCDPPFAVGTDFRFPVTVGTDNHPVREAVAYRDVWGTGADSYLHQMWERFMLLRDLLAPTGTLYLHCDWRMNAPLRLVLDEVFGAGIGVSKQTPGFRCEIVWCYREAINQRSSWNRKHDTLLMYTKSDRWTFNPDAVLQPHAETTVRKYRHVDSDGKPYRLMGRGIINSPIRSARDISPEWEKTHPELTFRHYLKPGTLPVDYWHIDIVNQASAERVDYPTQKPEALLERILLASSNPGDLVLDPYCGSGTTAIVAERLGRRWIAGDSSAWAIHTTRKRLLGLSERTMPFIVGQGGERETAGTVWYQVLPDDQTITLCGIEPVPDLSAVNRPAVDFIDFWAVGTRLPGQPFQSLWHTYRTHKNRHLATVAPLPTPPNNTIAVLAVDVQGRCYWG